MSDANNTMKDTNNGVMLKSIGREYAIPHRSLQKHMSTLLQGHILRKGTALCEIFFNEAKEGSEIHSKIEEIRDEYFTKRSRFERAYYVECWCLKQRQKNDLRRMEKEFAKQTKKLPKLHRNAADMKDAEKKHQDEAWELFEKHVQRNEQAHFDCVRDIRMCYPWWKRLTSWGVPLSFRTPKFTPEPQDAPAGSKYRRMCVTNWDQMAKGKENVEDFTLWLCRTQREKMKAKEVDTKKRIKALRNIKESLEEHQPECVGSIPTSMSRRRLRTRGKNRVFRGKGKRKRTAKKQDVLLLTS